MCYVNRFTNDLGDDYWKALIRILMYLRYTLNYELYYMRHPTILEIYNTNWIFLHEGF